MGGMFGDRSRVVVMNGKPVQEQQPQQDQPVVAQERQDFADIMEALAREDAAKVSAIREALGITQSRTTPFGAKPATAAPETSLRPQARPEAPTESLRPVARPEPVQPIDAPQAMTTAPMSLNFGIMDQAPQRPAPSEAAPTMPGLPEMQTPSAQTEPTQGERATVTADLTNIPKTFLRDYNDRPLNDTQTENMAFAYNHAVANGLEGDELNAYMAQLAHESDRFKTAEEYASGSAYENRRDLGNTQEGDGKRFKGRGFIQLTGRANYEAAGKELGVDLLADPSKVATDKNLAADVSLWFWKKNVRPRVQDFSDTRRITKIINGGYNGLDERKKFYSLYSSLSESVRPKERPADLLQNQTAAPADPNALGMIGGVKDDKNVWQSFDGSGMAHSADYKDYSQLFREYTTEQKEGYVPVGEMNGQTVYASPDYAKDENGNYISVNKDEAVALAAERGSILPTREMVKELYVKSTRIPMAIQPIGETGGTGDTALYTQKINEAVAQRGVKPGQSIVHGKEFFLAK